MLSQTTNLIKRIQPSAAPAPSPSFIHNTGLEFAEANHREKRQRAPDNGAVFRYDGANIITFRPPTSEIIDLSEGYMEFTLTLDDITEWAVPYGIEQLFKLITLEWGSDQVIELKEFGKKRTLDRRLEQVSQTNVDHSTALWGASSYANRNLKNGTKFRFYFSEIPVVTKNPLFLHLVPTLNFEIKFHLQQPTMCLDAQIAAPVQAAGYSISNVLFHWEKMQAPMDVVEEVKSALEGDGLHWAFEDWQRFEETFSTDTYERNLNVNYSSVKGVWFIMQQKDAGLPGRTWANTPNKPVRNHLDGDQVQSIQLTVDGKLIPQVPLDTQFKRFMEIARYYRALDDEHASLKINEYWALIPDFPSGGPIAGGIDSYLFGNYPGAIFDDLLEYFRTPIYYIDLETDRHGLISGLKNYGMNGTMNLSVKLNSTPTSPVTIEVFVLHDSIATLTKDRAYLTK